MNTVTIDENEVIHRGVREFLASSSFEVVAHCHRLQDYVQLMANGVKTDLILTEASVGSNSLRKVIETIKKQSGDAKLIVFSEFDVPLLVQEARELGADGFIPKSVSSSEFTNKLQELQRDGNIWSSTKRAPEQASLPKFATNVNSLNTAATI